MDELARDTNILVTNVGEIVKNEGAKIEVVNIDSNDVIFIWYDTKTIPAALVSVQMKDVEDKFKKLFPGNKVVTMSSNVSVSVMKQQGG